MRVDRVFIDTNVLLSGLIFNGNESLLLELAVAARIRLVIAQYVLDEARAVLQAKFPKHADVLDKFLELLDYELVPYPDQDTIDEAAKLLRDPNDSAVLASIIIAGPNAALTGDKDLLTERVRSVAPVCRCVEYLELRHQ